MTGSTSQTCELTMPRGGLRPVSWTTFGMASASGLTRLKSLLFGRRPEARPLPRLKNAHYVAVHMAAATHRRSLR